MLPMQTSRPSRQSGTAPEVDADPDIQGVHDAGLDSRPGLVWAGGRTKSAKETRADVPCFSFFLSFFLCLFLLLLLFASSRP